jgi:hypothetical protein
MARIMIHLSTTFRRRDAGVRRPTFELNCAAAAAIATTNAKPRRIRGASQDHHIAVVSWRCITATHAGG